MKVTFLTQGALGEADRLRVAEVLWKYMQDPDVEEMLFGFTEETTPGAAFALGYAASVRSQARADPRALVLTSVVPHRVSNLRAEAQHAIALGDQVVELAEGEGVYGLNRYSMRVVETVRTYDVTEEFWKGCRHVAGEVHELGQLVVFWDGNFIREPWPTVNHLQMLAGCRDDPPVVIHGCVHAPVVWEHVRLQGPPSSWEAMEMEQEEKKEKKRRRT